MLRGWLCARRWCCGSIPRTREFWTFGDVAREEAEPTFPTSLLEAKIRAVKEDFVETSTFREVERLLLDQGTAVVVGPAGEGKSTCGVMMCDRLKQEGYLCVFYESLDKLDTESIAKSRRNLCIVLDNVFGSSIVDTPNLNKWAQILRDLVDVQTAGGQEGGQESGEGEGSCGKKGLLLLLLSRDNVFREALDQASKLSLVLQNPACRIFLKSASSLATEEKKMLLRKYTGKIGKTLEEKDEDAILLSHGPIGFPQVCRLYFEIEAMHNKAVEFFSRPIALLLETLMEMMREDAMVRAALVLLVLQGGSIPLENIELPHRRESSGVNRAVHTIRVELGGLGSDWEVFQQLPKTVERLCGGLLTEERGRVSFSHDSVRDAVCVALAKHSLPFVAEHCSLAVLSQCIHLSDSPTLSFAEIQSQSVLAVPRRLWPLFTKRLVSELEKGKFRDVFTCSLLSHPGLCDLLITEAPKSFSFSEFVHREDVKCGLHFLFWASMASSNFLSCLLLRCEFDPKELRQGIFGCCVKGHEDLLGRIHHLLPEKKVEDWSVPIACWLPEQSKGESASHGSQCPRSSTGCIWGDLPVRTHSIPGTVAAEHGHVHVLRTLIGLGMPADVRDPEQRTPLMSACSCGKEEVVSFLVTSQEVDLIASDKTGSTPLHKSAEGGHGKIASMLVDKLIADKELNLCMNKVNEKLQTPLMLACRFCPELASLLLGKEAEVGKVDVDGKSCLHYAAEGGDPAVLKKLLESHAMDPNQVATSGWSPLHFACCGPKREQAVKVLLEGKAQAKAQDKSRRVTPLHIAAKHGCIETVKALVESSSDVIAAAESCPSVSSFLLACGKGSIDVARYLHCKHADIKRKDEDGTTALHYAVRSGNMESVRFLVEDLGVPVDVKNKSQQTPFLFACQAGQVEVVKYLREKKADLSMVDAQGNSGLHCAAVSGNVETVALFVEDVGVPVDVKNKFLHTPLLLACYAGQVEVVKYLREKKADVALADSQGNSGLHCAAYSGNVETVALFVEDVGVPVDVKNKFLQTPLLFACHKGQVEVVKYLREKKADLASADRKGNSGLHWAAMSGNVETVALFVEDLGVPVDVKNKSLQTPLLLACHKGQVEVVKYLREKKADLSIADSQGNSGLHWAAMSGNVETVALFVEDLGVPVDVKNKSLQTPLLLACQAGQVVVVKYLREKKADQ